MQKYKVGTASATNFDGDTKLFGIMLQLKPASVLSKAKIVNLPIQSFDSRSEADRDAALAELKGLENETVYGEFFNVPISYNNKKGDKREGMVLGSFWTDEAPSSAERKLEIVSQYCRYTNHKIQNWADLPQIIKSITFGGSVASAANSEELTLPQNVTASALETK